MSQRFLAEILEPRAWELFEMMRDNLRQARALDACTAGIVLTGGGARWRTWRSCGDGVAQAASWLRRRTPAHAFELAVPSTLRRLVCSVR